MDAQVPRNGADKPEENLVKTREIFSVFGPAAGIRRRRGGRLRSKDGLLRPESCWLRAGSPSACKSDTRSGGWPPCRNGSACCAEPSKRHHSPDQPRTPSESAAVKSHPCASPLSPFPRWLYASPALRGRHRGP